MKNILVILCFACIVVKNGTALSSEDDKTSRISETYNKVRSGKTEDLEGAETVGKLFNLKGIFPAYGTSPSYSPGRYPSTGGGYYPSSSGGYYPSSSGGYYPSSSGGYYPSSSGGYYPSYKPSNGFYPSSGNYPSSGYYPSGSDSGSGGYYPSSGTNILGHGSGNYPVSQSFYPTSNPWYRTTSDYGVTGTSNFGGYGGYGGNGGLNSYNGYNNPRYDGKRNLGYGYHSDTDRYGFYKSPSQQLSVYRGYD